MAILHKIHVVVVCAFITGYSHLAFSKDGDPGDNSIRTTIQLREQQLLAKAGEITSRALNAIGIRYKYGGTSPETGMDCSAFVRYIFAKALGTELPRTAKEQSQVGQKIESSELQPGDLVFYNTLHKNFSHVGIYIGNNEFIHSPSKGKSVKVENLNESYWKTRFNGARRINFQDNGNSYFQSTGLKVPTDNDDQN